MKLCDITQFFSPTSGGVKRYLLSKAEYIRAHQGMEHVLILPGSEDSCETDGPLTRYTIRSPGIPGTQSYRLLLRFGEIRKILQEEKPDLVEVGDPYQLGWASARLTRELNLPLVAFYHSDYPRALGRTVERFTNRWAARFAERWLTKYLTGLYNQMNATLVASDRMLEILRKCGVEPLYHTPIGIDTQIFRPRAVRDQVRRQLGIDPDRFLLLYVGRMSREKNIRVLLQTMDILERSAPGLYHLLLVGQGHLDQLVQRKCREHDFITWRPFCADSDRLAEIYSAADLFVHAGSCETYGLVVLEAQACGTPVVAIRGGGTDSLNQAGERFLAEKAHPMSLFKTICKARSALSEALRIKVRQDVAACYEVTTNFQKQFEVYREVLRSHRSGADVPSEKDLAESQVREKRVG